MLTYICDTHSDYPKRISANNLFYTEYKDQRPFFFHDVLIKEPMPEWSEPLVPTIDDFKDKYIELFNESKTAFVLNPDNLRSIPQIIEKPREQNPALSLGNVTMNGLVIY